MAFSHAARLLLALFTVVTSGRWAAAGRVLSGPVWTRGLCNLTVSENLPQGSVLPLPILLAPEETLDLTHNNAYFGLLTTPDNNTTTTTTTSGSGRGELELVWTSLIEEGVVATTRLLPSLVTLSPLDREFLCQREPECDCRYGNSHPDRRFASGPIDGVERLICRLGVDVIIRPIDRAPVPTKARLSAVSLIRFPRPERLYVCLADVNDNPPVFLLPPSGPSMLAGFASGALPTSGGLATRQHELDTPVFEVSLEEHSAVGREIALPVAFDADAAPDNTLHAYTIRCPDAAGNLRAPGNRGDAKADLEGLGGGLFSVSFGLDTPRPGLPRSTEAWLNLVVMADIDLEAEAGQLATAGEAAGRRVVGWPMVCVVEATDGLHTGQLGVRIRPKDVNDHRPAWQPPLLLTSKVHLEPTVNGSQTADDTVEWTVRLAESVSPYLPLLQLRARDPDRDFGQLTFRARRGPGSSPAAMFGDLDAARRALLGSANERASPLASSAASESASPFSLFRVDPASGEVSLTGRLDYETVRQSEEQAVVRLDVEVEDNGGLVSRARLNFRVLDVNDNRPEITFYSASRVGLSNGLMGPRQPVFGPGVTARTRLQLRENQLPSRPLDYLTVTDADGPSNGKPTCHLVDNPLPGVFNLTQLGPELWALVGLAPVDREQLSGKTSPSSAGVYHGLQTSRVAIAAPTLLQLIVRCQDNPEPWQPRLETRAVIVLEVVDENDNAPVFLSGRRVGDTGQPVLEAFLPENRAPGVAIARVRAHDPDAGDRLFFSLVDMEPRPANASVSVADILSIEPTTGLIVSVRRLDREERDVYANFGVMVRDTPPSNQSAISADTSTSTPTPKATAKKVEEEGEEEEEGKEVSGGHSAVLRLVLHVTDENDNAPIFTSPSVLQVSEAAGPNTLVVQLTANDPDEGRNGTVHFRLLGQLAPTSTSASASASPLPSPSPLRGAPFRVSPDGRLFVSQSLDREAVEHYELVVVAADQAGPEAGLALSTTATLLVRVTDVNDSPPRFPHTPDQLTRSLACSEAYTSLEVAAEDADGLPEHRHIAYRLLGTFGPLGRPAPLHQSDAAVGLRLFHMQPDTGLLVFAPGRSDNATGRSQDEPELEACRALGTYRLKLFAYDPTSPWLNHTVLVTVHLTPPPAVHSPGAAAPEHDAAATGPAGDGLESRPTASEPGDAARQPMKTLGAVAPRAGPGMSGRSARRRDDSLSPTGHLLPGFQTRRRSEVAAARPAGDSEVEHNQTPASNDLTLYGIVTLVCISVTLSLFMLILIVYLRRRQEKEPSGRLSAASAPTESEADAEAMTTNAKNEASLGFFLEHGRLGDALGGFTLPKRQMSPAGLMSRADTPQTRSATLISLATPNGLFFAQSRPEELMELKSKHAFYTCPFCQIFFISSESLRLARE